jgi:hypothetical protein
MGEVRPFKRPESKAPSGPWSGPERTAPTRDKVSAKPPRARREPLINSWKGLALCLVMMLVLPLLTGWLGHALGQLLGLSR